MSPLWTCLFVATLGACATARNEPRGEADAAVDAPRSSGSADAATSTGCANAFTGVLATWDFTGEAGNQASTAVKTTVTGIVAGPVQRAIGLTAVSGANAINSSNWSTAAQPDLTKYYALTIAPPSNCTLAITMVALDARASGTGPAMASVATSADGYAQKATASTAAASMAAVAVPAQGAQVELRIYGYDASATAGTLRLQTTLAITGSLQ
jgi:hypothetical protein